jgi:hypothetical protein
MFFQERSEGVIVETWIAWERYDKFFMINRSFACWVSLLMVTNSSVRSMTHPEKLGKSGWLHWLAACRSFCQEFISDCDSFHFLNVIRYHYVFFRLRIGLSDGVFDFSVSDFEANLPVMFFSHAKISKIQDRLRLLLFSSSTFFWLWERRVSPAAFVISTNLPNGRIDHDISSVDRIRTLAICLRVVLFYGKWGENEEDVSYAKETPGNNWFSTLYGKRQIHDALATFHLLFCLIRCPKRDERKSDRQQPIEGSGWKIRKELSRCSSIFSFPFVFLETCHWICRSCPPISLHSCECRSDRRRNPSTILCSAMNSYCKFLDYCGFGLDFLIARAKVTYVCLTTEELMM